MDSAEIVRLCGCWKVLSAELEDEEDEPNSMRGWNITGRKEKRAHGGIHKSGVESAQQRNRTTV
jgi:hypothetical protein